MKERVMVVQNAELRPYLTARLIRDGTRPILNLITTSHLFMAREIAEVSPEYRQIIPYVVIRNENEYFMLKRMPRQTEARLHHKLSLGVGGHINPGHSIVEGLQKELFEEVKIETSYDLHFIGILTDDSTDVGRVHLGVVYVLEAAEKRVTVMETEKMTGAWMPRRALAGVREAMESWSQIVYDDFIA
jgi:predicted NUDIX family phosphoesterase